MADAGAMVDMGAMAGAGAMADVGASQGGCKSECGGGGRQEEGRKKFF